MVEPPGWGCNYRHLGSTCQLVAAEPARPATYRSSHDCASQCSAGPFLAPGNGRQIGDGENLVVNVHPLNLWWQLKQTWDSISYHSCDMQHDDWSHLFGLVFNLNPPKPKKWYRGATCMLYLSFFNSTPVPPKKKKRQCFQDGSSMMFSRFSGVQLSFFRVATWRCPWRSQFSSSSA